MRDPTTWIKLDRNITEWRWYKDRVTFSVWVHLLLMANIEDREVGKRIVPRGTVVTNYELLASTLKLTYEQVRRAVENLKQTDEITISRHGKFVDISIVCYDRYQGENPMKTQSKPNPNNKNGKKNISLVNNISNINNSLGFYTDEDGFTYNEHGEVVERPRKRG